MTDIIPLAALPAPDARRDQWGRYLVLPPGADKPIGYTRVTTIAKQLDSGGVLAPWKASMTSAGIIMRRGLRAQWEALLAEYGDPWYASPESKAACKKLVEECAAVGGANDRSEVGTALHAITSLVDLGRKPKHLTQETERDVEAYVNGLAEAGVTIVPGNVELMTVLDSVKVAGTFDRIANVPGFDLPLIADLKTGSNLAYSWHSIAVQMAAYSRGEALYRQGPAKNGSEDVRIEMPAVNQDWGLIMWLAADTAGEAKLKLFLVDLAKGWDAFNVSLWARDWYKEKPARLLGEPVPTADADLEKVLEASVATTKARKARKATKPEPEPEDQLIDAARTRLAVRAWLQGRIDDIGKNPRARDELVAKWPFNTPSLRDPQAAHAEEQLVAVEQLLDGIEKAHSLGFPTARPGPVLTTHDEVVANVVSMFPGSTTSTTTTTPAKETTP